VQLAHQYFLLKKQWVISCLIGASLSHDLLIICFVQQIKRSRGKLAPTGWMVGVTASTPDPG
ncbi:hypothetical protein, partial [Pseudomonas sp. FSL R10-0399]|uniref:hypothetical protein n=1 Tax=Pseudomonas sp. FSL R10-0399 TaxID=2662194 RepID=UPI001C4981F5